ncbi:CPBP family glutamic-type intramembrane protease [Derxia gummosa]|uniref:CPBP family glutamic-type intramembrane protease n=1 Tax=Derxia gummosa DSM 723 TaxID=1121388 RepID=A0A8B6XBV6_9BURK|nr:CPBP family glutamic-type intramembrane protease [Derxia gummosa]
MTPSSLAPLRARFAHRRLPDAGQRWLIGAALAMPVLAGFAALAGPDGCGHTGQRPGHPPSFWLLLGPVVEECALRAGFQNGLRELWPGARRWRIDAWLASAVYSLLLLGHRHPAQLLALALASLVIGLVHARLRDAAEAGRGGVFAGLPQAIGLHALFNLSLLLTCGSPPPPIIPLPLF